ncbi:MAG: phosphoglycerate kinase [Candidatus Paceibacterota bacterium]
MDIPRITRMRNMEGKRILLRASLNAPIENGKVKSVFRLKKAQETIKYLSSGGARVILLGHIGSEGKESLLPVYEELKGELPLSFVPFGLYDEKTRDAIENMQNGEVLLLENIRRESGEKENSNELSLHLASFADVYVNDAFSVSHRRHASVVGVPRHLPSYAGLCFDEERRELTKALNPDSPSLLILGGAKFHTKEPLIEKSLKTYDDIFVGGALANDFFKACGFRVGRSDVSEATSLEKLARNESVLIPRDVVVEKNGASRIACPEDIHPEEKIVDVGPETIFMLSKLIDRMSFVLWNGPLGKYEDGYREHTEALARLLSQSDAYTIIGGGDTVASIEHLHLEESFDFISTAGGAMIEFLTNGTLPGIEALKKSR